MQDGQFLDTLIEDFFESNKKALQINDLQGLSVVEAGGFEPPSADSQPLGSTCLDPPLI